MPCCRGAVPTTRARCATPGMGERRCSSSCAAAKGRCRSRSPRRRGSARWPRLHRRRLWRHRACARSPRRRLRSPSRRGRRSTTSSASSGRSCPATGRRASSPTTATGCCVSTVSSKRSPRVTRHRLPSSTVSAPCSATSMPPRSRGLRTNPCASPNAGRAPSRVLRRPPGLRQTRHAGRAWYYPLTLASGSDPRHESRVVFLASRLRALAAAFARLFAPPLLQPLAATLAPPPELALPFGPHRRHPCIMWRRSRQDAASSMEASRAEAGAPAADDRLLTPRFVRVTAANFFFFLNFASFFLLPLHVRALGGSERTIGLVMGTSGVAGLAAVLVIAAVLDRVGCRRFLLAGIATMGAASAAFLFVHAIGPAMYLLRIVQGVAFAAAFNAASTLAVVFAPATRRAAALGLFGVSTLTTHALAPAFGELLIG